MVTATTSSGTTTYTYDSENRLTNVEIDGTMSATYTYIAFNQRIGIQEGGTQTWTVFNGTKADANAYADFTGSGSLATRYLYGPAVDEILARTSASGTTAWYMTDQIGSVRSIEDTSGDTLDAITYDPFGNIVTQTNATDADRFLFAGMEYDSVTGLYYDHARYYDAAIGRFVSQDPMGFAAGDTNLYRYVGNAPTLRSDPSGTTGWGATGGAVGGLAGGSIVVGIVCIASGPPGWFIGGAVIITGGVVGSIAGNEYTDFRAKRLLLGGRPPQTTGQQLGSGAVTGVIFGGVGAAVVHAWIWTVLYFLA